MQPPYGYWTFNGTNGLKGAASTIEILPDGRRVIVKNPENPAILEDQFILNAIRNSWKARNDFNTIFPTLLPDEQDRLSTLLALNPRNSALEESSQDYFDKNQSREVTAGVHVRLPKPTNRLPGGL